jgi:GH25 family lysozyme M1 (1,4-beta-N-acetylmuramidase)
MSVGDEHTHSRLALLRATVLAVLVAVMGAVSAGAASAASARVYGPDVSSNNHANRHMVNWRVMQQVGGAAFTFIKATEGRDYVNSRFASDFRGASRMFRGAYHFARPSGRNFAQISYDAKAEANFFIRNTGTMNGPGILPPVLDIENAGSLRPHQLKWWTRIWLRQVKALTGRTPIIYTYGDFWKHSLGNSTEFTAYPLWLAHYGVRKARLVGGWKRYTFWQYTDRGRLAGSGLRLDMNLFNGSRAQLQALTIGKPLGPETSRAAGASRKPVGQRGAAKPGPSRAPAVSESLRSLRTATMRYFTRVRAADQAERPHMWPNVFTRGGIREIGQ